MTTSKETPMFELGEDAQLGWNVYREREQLARDLAVAFKAFHAGYAAGQTIHEATEDNCVNPADERIEKLTAKVKKWKRKAQQNYDELDVICENHAIALAERDEAREELEKAAGDATLQGALIAELSGDRDKWERLAKECDDNAKRWHDRYEALRQDVCRHDHEVPEPGCIKQILANDNERGQS